ncbi:MAG TPA: sensor histidine kinase [Cyclobacteriaceae bacterium]|jgi:signal transduction histidine kinase|nr:sensor histidine kinase [Cyclobacteriaceae bacterium]
MIYKICLWFVFISVSISAEAQNLILTDAGHIAVKNKLQYFRDAQDTIKFSDLNKVKFITPEDEQLNFGFDGSPYWIKIEITNQSLQHDWMLELAYSPIDSIDFYIQHDSASNSTWMHKISGDRYPIGIRDVPHRLPLFTFSIDTDESKTIYLRVRTTSSVQLPLTLWHRNAFVWASFKIQILNGLFYGAMLMMILYQLVLFISIRDKITFFYVLTLLSMLNIVSFFQGYTFLYVHPGIPMFNDWFAILSGPVFVLCSTLLTGEFLHLKQHSPTLSKLMIGNMVLDMTVVLLMVIFSQNISYKFHHYFILIHCVIVLVSTSYCLYKKYKPALYYLLAWITLLLAASVFTLSNLGFVPGYLSTNYIGLMVGCILQMFFISFALGERWNELRKENQRVKELELKRGIEEKERLEREVRLRTVEIQHQKDRLEETNKVKDKLFSVVSHDIKGPLNSLKLALFLAHAEGISSKEFKEVVTGLENHLGKTNEFIQNLLEWAKLQLKGELYEPVQMDLNPLLNETIALMKPELERKNILIRKTINARLPVYADPNMIKTVIRNLLTNAIKFTPSGGEIILNCRSANQQLIVSVSDTGVGIAESYRKRIFTLESVTTLGTHQEAGTGLGLVLCKEYVEKNKGNIWFESTEGEGTTFYFSLPETQEKMFA